MISKLRYIIYIIIFVIAFYFYIFNRTSGCSDKEAINYNPEADIGDKSKCLYKVPGCMDKNAGNYNKFANASCEEDCLGCEEKGTCDLCKNQINCKKECPECICKPKVKGCNRTWAINYDPKSSEDNGTCIGPNDFLKKISVISGGDCDNCSGRASIKIGDEYPLLGGKQGINVLVVERNNNFNIRYNRGFMTGNYENENKKFVDFMRKYVFYRDIVIITIRGDAVGTKRENNQDGNPVFITSILTEDSKKILEMLGAKNINLARQGSYILIGSYLNDVYYETYSSNADSYFPYFNLNSYGCINFNHPKFEKIELNMNNLKFMQSTGDANELEVFNEKSNNESIYNNLEKDKLVEMNRVDNINRFALEIIQKGYKLFSVSKSKCYVYRVKNEFRSTKENKDKIDSMYEDEEIRNTKKAELIDEVSFFKKRNFIKYSEDNKYFRIPNNICRLNSQYLPYGNDKDESLFHIDEIYYSGLFSQLFGGQLVELYQLSNHKGLRRDVGIGIHEAWGVIPPNVNSGTKIQYYPIGSMKIPNGYKVTLFRNVLKDEDLQKFKTYEIKFNDDYDAFIKINLSCCEGAKIITRDTETKKEIRTVEFRTWKNVIRNLDIEKNEVKCRLFIYDERIERKSNAPDSIEQYIYENEYDVSRSDNILKLKSYKGFGKIGFIQTYGFNGNKVRRINFSTWENFWNLYFVDILKPWNFYYRNIKTIDINNFVYPKEGNFIVSCVNPEKKLLRKTCTLHGYAMDSKEISSGITHKKCNNIAKYGNCDNNDSTANPFTPDIKYLIVSKNDFGVTIFQNPGFEGASFTLSYGRYNLPEDMVMIVNSLKLFGDNKYTIVRFFSDYNFENEFVKFIHKSAKEAGSKYSYGDLNELIPVNKKVKSLIIEKIDYPSILGNNPYPKEYDENKKYENGEYPYTYKLTNDIINNMDFPYDYFLNPIKLNNEDKYVRIVKEIFAFSFLQKIEIYSFDDLNKENTSFYKLLNNIKYNIIHKEGELYYCINSGGGIDWLEQKWLFPLIEKAQPIDNIIKDMTLIMKELPKYRELDEKKYHKEMQSFFTILYPNNDIKSKYMQLVTTDIDKRSGDMTFIKMKIDEFRNLRNNDNYKDMNEFQFRTELIKYINDIVKDNIPLKTWINENEIIYNAILDGKNIYNLLREELRVLKIYGKLDNNNIRKLNRTIVIFKNKYINKQGNNINYEEYPIEELSFDRSEKEVKICTFDDEEREIYMKIQGILSKIHVSLLQFGKYLALKRDGKMERVSYEELFGVNNLNNFFNSNKINIVLYDDNKKKIRDDLEESIKDKENIEKQKKLEEQKLIEKEVSDSMREIRQRYEDDRQEAVKIELNNISNDILNLEKDIEVIYENNISNVNPEDKSLEEYNIYVVRRPPASSEVPQMAVHGYECVCNSIEDEYDSVTLIYKNLMNLEFKKTNVTIPLAREFTDLKELEIIEYENYKILNMENAKSKPPIIQILNNKLEINNAIYFNCHKYAINNRVNSINSYESYLNQGVSKFEKNAKILLRSKIETGSGNYMANGNFQYEFGKTFNLRQDLNSALYNNIQEAINIVNNQIKKEGMIESYDINKKLIRKRKVRDGLVEGFGKVQNISNEKFGTDEKIIVLYDENMVKLVVVPIILIINQNSISSALKGLSYKNNNFIKFYDINSKLVRVLLCKNNKYIIKDKNKYLSLDYEKYKNNFDKFNWITADLNYTIDLDQIFVSMELENGIEYFYTNINKGNSVSKVSDIITTENLTWKKLKENEDQSVPMDIVINYFSIYSEHKFYDYDNNLTKHLKLSYLPIINTMALEAPKPILLYDNAVKYLESYKNDTDYVFYQKDKKIMSIYIPNGMKGVYSYKVNGKVVYADKITSDDGKLVKVYDESGKYITESDDINLHKYILGVKFDKYDGKFILEYYPKMNKTIIRLLNKVNNVDNIKLIDGLSKNSIVIENNFYSLKVTNPNGKYKFRYSDKGANF